MSIDPATQPTEERDQPELKPIELYPWTHGLILVFAAAIIFGGIAFFYYGSILQAIIVANVVGLFLGSLWGMCKLVRPWLVRRSKSRLLNVCKRALCFFVLSDWDYANEFSD